MDSSTFKSEAVNHVNSWNSTLEELLRGSSFTDREPIAELNKKRWFAISGPFPVFFGDMLGLETDKNVANVSTALNLACSYVDRCIDHQIDSVIGSSLNPRESARRMIDGFYDMFIGEKSSSELLAPVKPLVGYVVSAFPENLRFDLFKVLEDYKEAAKAEFDASTIDEKEKARIQIGKTYAAVVSFMIDTFSKKKMGESHRKSIENYMVGFTLADDFADFFADIKTPVGSHLYDRVNQGEFLPAVLFSQIKQSLSYFLKGRKELDDSKQRTSYTYLSAIALMLYTQSFLKKTWGYLLNHTPNSPTGFATTGAYTTR